MISVTEAFVCLLALSAADWPVRSVRDLKPDHAEDAVGDEQAVRV